MKWHNIINCVQFWIFNEVDDLRSRQVVWLRPEAEVYQYQERIKRGGLDPPPPPPPPTEFLKYASRKTILQDFWHYQGYFLYENFKIFVSFCSLYTIAKEWKIANTSTFSSHFRQLDNFADSSLSRKLQVRASVK